MGREQTARRIPQIPGQLDKPTLNEFYRQLSEMIYSLEGRRGPNEQKDSVHIKTDDRHTPLRLAGKGSRGVGAISFGGPNNASMYFAKGAYMNDNGSWVAEDATAVIMEMNRDSTTPQMYRNEGLQVGQIFTPISVGYVATGTSSGAPSVPGTTTVLPDPLTPMAPRPHTHLVQDIANSPLPADNDWILAGQIFGG